VLNSSGAAVIQQRTNMNGQARTTANSVGSTQNRSGLDNKIGGHASQSFNINRNEGSQENVAKNRRTSPGVHSNNQQPTKTTNLAPHHVSTTHFVPFRLTNRL
jgi:hypothetical protein